MARFHLDDGRITAALGPTNTGKTHRALQRMLQHRSGMMGLPLRLLAQEVYEKVVAAKGEAQVALVTGEQKIIPHGARYWICTVEAMPTDRPVAFLAVDEIQLAGSRNRGHVFTDRLLNARGVRETWFMGSDTIEPLLRELVPTAEILKLERLSALRYAGPSKLLGLKRRSAVVAFSANDVYALAERLRSRHGGTAVVMGALSPRARNKQVALYQAGEVDYMVATDAIGMGLNMDVDHVALAALRKFDGWQVRDLRPSELAQIAGRAGRHSRDGTFGTLNSVGPMPEDAVWAIEEHQFRPLKRLYWRNSDLDLRSFDALTESLAAPPPRRFLVQVRDWIDQQSFKRLAERDDFQPHRTSAAATERIWQVCQIPDFRKTLTDAHVQLLASLAHFLLGPGRVPKAWIAGRLDRLDRVDGDIDALMTRIAWVRTWNYIAFRSDWLDDARGLQERCRQLEDRLSDALHDQLTRRFVERRTVILHEEHDVDHTDEVVGRIEGLRFVPTPGRRGELPAELRAQVTKSLSERLDRLTAQPDLRLEREGGLSWEGGLLATLQKGDQVAAPRVHLLRNPYLSGPDRARLQALLEDWLRGHCKTLLGPRTIRRLRPGARALLQDVWEGLGSAPVSAHRKPLAQLSDIDRRLLAKAGVRLGTRAIFVKASLSPEGLGLRHQLVCLHQGRALPRLKARAERPGPDLSPRLWPLLGYAPLGELAVRFDALEELAALARQRSRRGPFNVDRRFADALGRSSADAREALEALGYEPAGRRLTRPRRRTHELA